MHFKKFLGYLPYSRKIIKYYREKNLPLKITIFDNEMFLHDHGYVSISLAKHGLYEKTITDYIFENLVPNSSVLDIGANIGYYTLIMAKLVGTQGNVFAFEPEPSNFKILSKNIKINNYTNVNAEKFILSEHDGKTKLFLSNSDPGSHKIFPSNNTDERNIIVDSISVDSYFKKHSIDPHIINFIKMDVEGSEFSVLKGMKTILDKKNDLKIILEYDPIQFKKSNINPIDILKFLDTFHFKFFMIDNKSDLITPLSLNYDHMNIEHLPGNYLLCIK